jgi:membrane-associated phospholipid phosphatase
MRPDGLAIFVPAIMSAGLLVSLYTLVRDALHARRWRGTDRRIALAAHATAQQVLTGGRADPALLAGLRPRVSYLLTALASGGVACYVVVGATHNYFTGGLLGELAWLWAASLVASAGFAAVSVVSTVAFWTWPALPRWLRPLLARTPLGQQLGVPDPSERRPSLLLGWAASAVVAAAALLVFVMARAPYVFAPVDGWVSRVTARWGWVEEFAPLDALGRTHPSVLLAAVIGLATLRCVPFAATYLTSVAVGLVANTAVKSIVDRPRPPGGPLAAWTDSFPSGHMIQATLIAGLLPLALLVFTRRRWIAVSGAVVVGLAVVVSALLRLHQGVHWWSDVVAGVLIGAAIGLVGWWVLADGRRHRRCRRCPWSVPRAAPQAARQVLLQVPPRVEAGLRWATRGWLLASMAGFLVLAVTVGFPRNPEGEGMLTGLELPVQLALLGLAGLGWLLGWRWEAAAAVLLVLVANLLGVFAAVAYQPMVSMLVAVAFLLPAAGFWLVWQHRRTLRSVTAVAVVTAVVVAGTWVGASSVYGYYYGPAHPVSAQRALPVDRVVWSWTGGVTSESATVVAELVPGTGEARLLLEADSGAGWRGAVAVAGRDGVVRLPARDLAPGTAYRYTIEVDGEVDASRGVGRFRTMPAGPSSFTVAVGACARTGSSGAVFDAIAATDPLLYLSTGDLHYGNPDRNDVDRFGGLYRRTLTAPAQAALYRSVPVAYVWDDHDYGPNDADAGSPARPAARTAYRTYVPHYPLPDPGAIYQAFTVGRVRFVMVDTRSERTATSMLGAAQLAWLERELVTASRSHALVVWVNPDPWVAAAAPGADNWGGYPEERRRIADLIAEAGIDNLVMLSGDAHMVAIDDGANTDYSTGGGAGFPLLHAAALDRPGSRKGGPYSEGAFPGAGQFGTLTVTDDGGSSVGVELAGRNWRGEVLVSYRTVVAAAGWSAGGLGGEPDLRDEQRVAGVLFHPVEVAVRLQRDEALQGGPGVQHRLEVLRRDLPAELLALP